MTMSDERFAHMLKLSVIYIPVLRDRQMFDSLEELDDGDRHNVLNCLEIVADTFVEMQRRLNVKPRYKLTATIEADHDCNC